MYHSRSITEKGKSRDLSDKRSLNNKDGAATPFWTGFIDGEGEFNIFVSKDQNRKIGWRVQVRFQIGLHKNDLVLLQKLQQYLGGVGSIHPNKDLYLYFIDSKEGERGAQRPLYQGRLFPRKKLTFFGKSMAAPGLINLINHVEAYPLQTQKMADFLLFKKAVRLVENKEHPPIEGLPPGLRPGR